MAASIFTRFTSVVLLASSLAGCGGNGSDLNEATAVGEAYRVTAPPPPASAASAS